MMTHLGLAWLSMCRRSLCQPVQPGLLATWRRSLDSPNKFWTFEMVGKNSKMAEIGSCQKYEQSKLCRPFHPPEKLQRKNPQDV